MGDAAGPPAGAECTVHRTALPFLALDRIGVRPGAQVSPRASQTHAAVEGGAGERGAPCAGLNA